MDSVFINDVDKNSAILQQFLIKHLVLLPDLQEVNSVAEYIILLITNGSSKEQIVEELATLGINDKNIASDLLDRVFYAIEKLKSGVSGEELMKLVPNAQPQQHQAPPQQQPQLHQQALPQQQAPPQQQPQLHQQVPPQQQAPMQPQTNGSSNFQFSFGNAAKATVEEVNQSGSLDSEDFFTPKSLISKRQAQNKLKNTFVGNPVGAKNNTAQRGGKFAVGSRFHERTQRNHNHPNAVPQTRTSLIRTPKLGRCPEFPNCPLSAQNCPHAHPNVICRAYPDCPNVNGTCSYLHPDEDEALIELVKQNKVKMSQKREEIKRISLETQKQRISGITLCKFGAVCSNPKCPFGHPTPINEDQKVAEYSWCPENLACSNPNCTKAHSSASKVKPVAPAIVNSLVSRGQGEKLTPEQRGLSLEQCKYNEKCTNKRCKFRHAKSATLCREGAGCTRYDCIFSHPIQENCKWNTECTNPRCLFQHPNGKNNSSEVFNPQIDYTAPDSSMANDLPSEPQMLYAGSNNYAHREHAQPQFQFGQSDHPVQFDLSQQQQNPPFNFNQPHQ